MSKTSRTRTTGFNCIFCGRFVRVAEGSVDDRIVMIRRGVYARSEAEASDVRLFDAHGIRCACEHE